MPTKDELNQQYTQTTHKITSTYENWCDFLVTVGKLHKYSFSDQVLIHEQRPEAVACADYKVWNNKMNRYIKKGATGIALIDDSRNDIDKVSQTIINPNQPKINNFHHLASLSSSPIVRLLSSSALLCNKNY